MNNVIASLATVLPAGLVQFQAILITLTQTPDQLNMEEIKAVAEQVSVCNHYQFIINWSKFVYNVIVNQ